MVFVIDCWSLVTSSADTKSSDPAEVPNMFEMAFSGCGDDITACSRKIPSSGRRLLGGACVLGYMFGDCVGCCGDDCCLLIGG